MKIKKKQVRCARALWRTGRGSTTGSRAASEFDRPFSGKATAIPGIVTAIAMLVLILSNVTITKAGEINANEANLVSAASGTFEYEGKTYRASSQYVGELRSYLCNDDVDLTAEDVSSLISDMYANVGAGVQEGYLEEVGGSPDQIADTSEASAEEEPETDQPTEPDNEEKGDEEAETKGEDPWSKLTGDEAEHEPEKEQPAYTVEETPEETQIVDSEGSVIFSAASMIKTVGYHTQNVRGLCVLGILILTAICGGTFFVIKYEKA